MMVRGTTGEGKELKRGRVRMQCKKNMGIDRDRGAEVLIFPA